MIKYKQEPMLCFQQTSTIIWASPFIFFLHYYLLNYLPVIISLILVDTPVSYTHLDVYKRQVRMWSHNPPLILYHKHYRFNYPPSQVAVETSIWLCWSFFERIPTPQSQTDSRHRCSDTSVRTGKPHSITWLLNIQ